jgi:hypothetical protein
MRADGRAHAGASPIDVANGPRHSAASSRGLNMGEVVRVRERRQGPRIVVALTLALFALSGSAASAAKDKPKSAPSPAASPAKAKSANGKTNIGPPPGESVNACGCYHDAKGGCVCTDKKGKCDCPGECEPVGCDEKRDKEMEREMAAEIKRARDDEKKRQAAQEAEEKVEEKVEDTKAEETSAKPDAGEVPPPPVAAKAAPKPSRKDPGAKAGGKSEPK